MFFRSYIQSEVKKALGVVTPEMYNGDLQKCLDDERPSWFTKPFYEIEETLHINNPFKIVYGNYSQLLPLDNIDVFSLNAREFLVKDLILNNCVYS